MKPLRNRSIGVIWVVLFLLFSGVPQSAAESVEADDWKFSADLYLWGAGIGGQSGTGSDLDIDFDSILSDLQMAFMGGLEARRGKWSFKVDTIYLDMGEDDTLSGINVNVEISSWIVTPMAGYTLFESEQGSMDIVLGARYLYLDTDLTLGSDRYSDSGHVWDGIAGVRGQITLNQNWYLPYHLDIGTGDSDMTWQGLLGIGYRFSKCDVVLAYRYLDWDFGRGKAVDNMNISGPLIGIKFFF